MYIPKWHLWFTVFTFSETQLYYEGRKTEPWGGNGNREAEAIGNIDR